MLVYKRVCAFVLRSCVIARIVIESGIHGMLNLRDSAFTAFILSYCSGIFGIGFMNECI